MYSESDKVYQIVEKSLLELCTGGFARRVLVVAQTETDYLGNVDFLKKILLAAGLELERDTLFVQMDPTENGRILPAIRERQADKIVVFGTLPAQLGLNIQIPLYQPVDFNGATFLFSEKLSVIESDKTRKTNLWQALRQLFL
ncbi:MAG: hypothetical protein ACKVU2_08490 [Saprospiraceae bacterium]